MKNHTIQLGSATPAPSWAGPHALARLLTGQTRLSTAPPPDTVSRPTCQPLLLSSVRSAARTRRTSRAPVRFGLLPTGRRSPVSRDPLPLLVPRVRHASATPPDPHRPPASPAPFQKGTERRRRASAPLFSPPSSHSEHPAANLVAVRPSRPRSTPFPHPNSGCSAAVVHPLDEPPTESFPRQSQPHLTSLSLSPMVQS
jgi:hypothetical protein